MVQKDSDGDGVPDSEDAFPLDARETQDSDEDGLGDNFENAQGLDANNPSDADLDLDGDGVTNLAEYLSGTDIGMDDQPPVFLTPDLPRLVADASSRLTPLALGPVLASDFKDGVIEAVVDNPGPYESGTYQLNWRAEDSSGNHSTISQQLTVQPLLQFKNSDRVAEGVIYSASFELTGEALEYPIRVPFSLSGTASNGDDFTIQDKEVLIEDGLVGIVEVAISDDELIEEMETIEILISGDLSGVALPPKKSMTLKIFDKPVAPIIRLAAVQDDMDTLSVSSSGGLVRVSAEVLDVNGSHHFDWRSFMDDRVVWSETENVHEIVIDPRPMVPGMYYVRVGVVDSEIPGETFVETLKLEVVLGEVAPDRDKDGVPDELDQRGEPNLLQALISEIDEELSGNDIGGIDELLCQSEFGTVLTLGEASRLTKSRANIPESTLEEVYGVSDENFDYVSGLYDFEISSLPDVGNSVKVVLPLYRPLEEGAVFRKLNGREWVNFFEDLSNSISSSPGSFGICPPPGDSSYSPGLIPGNYCLQLSIEDGGPNDSDGQRNGSIDDPGGIALLSSSLPTLKASLRSLRDKIFPRGAGEVVTLAFQLAAETSNIVLEGIEISVQGDLEISSDVSRIALYLDENDDGVPDETEFVSSLLPSASGSVFLEAPLSLEKGVSSFLVTFSL